MHHAFHPDVLVAGLQDDCPACEEHAANPFAGLSDGVLVPLIRLARNPERLAVGRSHTELVAAANILNVLQFGGGDLGEPADPLEGYLRDRWRIRCRIQGPEMGGARA